MYDTEDFFVKPLFSIAGLATQLVFLTKYGSKPKGILLDVGDGTCRDILDNKLDFLWFNHICISHGHYDHMGGLYSFLGLKRMLGSEDLIQIIYPENCFEVENCVKSFQDNYSGSIPFGIKLTAVSSSKKTSINIDDDIMVTSFPVQHRGSTLKPGILPLIPACGYQIYSITKNFRMAFSGDTAPCEILYDLFSSDVDIGFIESTHPTDDWVKDKINRFHLTESEALEYSKNCKKTEIIHTLPPHILENNKQ